MRLTWHFLALLGTYPELDPFGNRSNIRYRGAWGQGQGVAPWWPPVKGKRIFTYVKVFDGLTNLLDALRELAQPTIVYCSSLSKEMASAYSKSTIAFAKKPVELGGVGSQCDIAVSHASHGTAATLLLAGKPQLLFPTHLEQRLTAQAIVRHGAGLAARPLDKASIKERLEALLSQRSFTDSAERMQACWSQVSPNTELQRAADELETLAASN